MQKTCFTILLIFFTFLFNTAFGQSYFSKRYYLDNNSAWSFSENIITEPFGYTLQVEDGTVSDPWKRRIGFLRLDSLGDRSSFLRIYQYDSLTLGTEYGGSFIKIFQNTGYSLTGYISQWVSNGRYDQGILMRFDNNLDTLWTKLYTDTPPHDSSIMFMNCRELNDYGYIIVGGQKRVDGDGYQRANLFRTDSLGNLKWKNTYGPQGATEYQLCDVTVTSDNGYALGGGFVPEDQSSQAIDGLIIKVDSLGNQQWMKHLGSPLCRDGGVFVDQASDGNIQAGTVYSDSCFGNDGYFSRINFVKLTNNQEIIWDIKYGLAKYWNSLNKIRVLSNGDIIATGDYWRPNLSGSYIITGWIIKTDFAGNEEWYREYGIVYGNDSENNLFNVTLSNDNGFVACGMVYPTPPDTGFENSWVLKVDSIGCQGVNDCWVGMNEIIVKTYTPNKPYVVYPNPASDNITIEFHENSKGAEIEIFDQIGIIQYKSRLAPNRDEINIDISKWKPEVYVVRVILDERTLGTDKIIKM